MLYLHIQKWKEAIKTSDFQQYIGGVTACMEIIMKATEGCGQLSLNDAFIDDRWFNRAKTGEEANTEGLYYCRPANTRNKGFYLATSEK